jgi:hypothetical protein
VSVACAVGAVLPALRGLDDPRLVPARTHPDRETLHPDQRLSEAKEHARGRDQRTNNDAEYTDARTSEPLTTARSIRAPAWAAARTEAV